MYQADVQTMFLGIERQSLLQAHDSAEEHGVALTMSMVRMHTLQTNDS